MQISSEAYVLLICKIVHHSVVITYQYVNCDCTSEIEELYCRSVEW